MSSKVEFARKLRRKQTHLRNRQLIGLKFRRQFPLGPYVLDFYCHEIKLCLEIDGGQHFEEDAMRHDKERTGFLVSQGIKILRFGNVEILNNIEGALVVIEQIVPHLNPLPKGEETVNLKPDDNSPLPQGEGWGEGTK